MTATVDPTVLASARDGDARAFETLTSPFRKPLLAHCYRMLGSTADADDAVQEAFIRAWKHLATFESRASLSTWLHTIATRVCLDALEHRGPRRLPSLDDSPSADPKRPPGAPVLDPVWLEPLRDDAWCDRDTDLDARECPESSCTRRESVAIAFLAVIQMLPATQRAALLLHEVAGWKSAEIADALGSSVAAVNSSLQRARFTLDARAPDWDARVKPPAATERDVLSRYVRAWETGDSRVLAGVLRDDAVLAMPPVEAWLAGRDAISTFFDTFVMSLGMTFTLREAPDVNGARAMASYRSDASTPGVMHADGLHVFTLDSHGAIASVMVFMGPHAVLACGMPATVEAGSRATVRA